MNTKPRAGLLTAISVSRIVPRRWTDLYYSMLERLGYETLSTEDQVIADGIAYSYVEFAEARETLRDDDKKIGRDAPDFEAIQKRLLRWLAAWSQSQKKPEQSDLARELSKYGEGYGIENID